MEQKSTIYHFNSISRLMSFLGQPAPEHPLLALVNYDKELFSPLEKGKKIILDFYKISFKNKFAGQVKYGQGYYDFEEGGLAFLRPKQVVFSPEDVDSYEGYALYFHPDFIRSYPLTNAIAKYGFFSYDSSEALFLSTNEKKIIQHIFEALNTELERNTDQFSQDIVVSQIELLLNYSNRFYNRQFLSRKTAHHEIITQLDSILEAYFTTGLGLEKGLPAVNYICTELKVSSRYLSDMLGSLTGQNTQQYIQNKLIEQSKNLLSTTTLSISEIAFHLGFGHHQSFNKLFKTKTNLTPLEFRQSFI
jgi:AraC family transcriptional activator of pobA